MRMDYVKAISFFRRRTIAVMMRKCWAALGITAFAVIPFSSCNDDDDESGENNATDLVPGQPPLVADAGIQYPVTAYCVSDVVWQFRYADGRMTGGCDPSELPFAFRSNPMDIYVGERPDDYVDLIIKDVKVNGSGFITSAQFTYAPGYMNEAQGYFVYYAHVQGTVAFTYDAEGHLIGEKTVTTDYEASPICKAETNVAYTWQNGNLVRAEVFYKDDADWIVGYTNRWEYTYDTSRYPNPGIFVHVAMSFRNPGYQLSFVDEYCPFLYYAGMLGRPTKNIPTGAVFDIDDQIDDYSYVLSLTDVATNGNGSVRYVMYDCKEETNGHEYYIKNWLENFLFYDNEELHAIFDEITK